MTTENLLCAVRPVFLLIPRPDQLPSTERKFWAMQIDGLHTEHIKRSAKALRDARKRPEQPLSSDPSLKVSGLHHGLANALGSKSFDAWKNTEPELINFLATNGMEHPADLISWSRMHSHRLTARQVSDRIFNSGLPIPDRIFTGVGSSKFLAASGRGYADIHYLSEFSVSGEHAKFNWCMEHANQTVLSLDKESGWDNEAPDHLDLSGTDLLLQAFKFEYIAYGFNLLGDNLVSPASRPPEFRMYNYNQDDLAFANQIFDVFRKEIERTQEGWVEIVPFPGNNNIVFLKGPNGKFDWVVRNQRDAAFSGNPYYPILRSDELPTAMKPSAFKAHLYFMTGEWYERLEHSAETRHYEEGGSTATWPGYTKLLQRELVAARRNYQRPTSPKGGQVGNFVPHRLDGYCLMVSPLVTIREFWHFFENSDWRNDRIERSSNCSSKLEADLSAVNLHDDDLLPTSVTWFDAVAFCRHYEKQTGLPVRLLEVEEWQKISPTPLYNLNHESLDETEEYDGVEWSDLTWAVTGGDGLTGGETSHRYPETCAGGGFLRFGKELNWTENHQGLPFVTVVDFGEWLDVCTDGYAPAANAVTGQALMTGPLERDKCPAHLTMRRKGLKVGFRLCYVAQPDA
ncbi:formylglycine-generating enzyme family protein [Aquitalea palustris]|nr:formylglycine-generating enzyme family protein [Aquitalea palustris]